MNLSEEEFLELKNLISFAISEGYNTTLLTKKIVNKLNFTKDEMKWLDDMGNIGEKLL